MVAAAVTRRESRKPTCLTKMNWMTSTCWYMSLCLQTRSKADGFLVFLPVGSSIHPSVFWCQSHYVGCASVPNLDSICRLCSVVCLFSGSDCIPLSLPALWSHIIPNTVKSAKHKPRVNANQIRGPLYCICHPAVSLNPPFLVSHSLPLYFFIHSPKCGVNRAKAGPVLLPDETLLNIW